MCAARCCRKMRRQSGPAREGYSMDGVEVKGVFNANAFFQTLAAILSRKYGKEITVTVTPPAQDERAARPAKGRGKSEQRVSA